MEIFGVRRAFRIFQYQNNDPHVMTLVFSYNTIVLFIYIWPD